MNVKGSAPKHTVGDKVGRLTVVERAGSTRHKAAKWLCSCDCGAMVTITGHALGKTVNSCGCIKRETTKALRWAGVGDIPMSYWNGVLYNAKKRSIPVTITLQYAWSVLQSQNGVCALSGTQISTVSPTPRRYYGTASLDRIDNTKGYVEGNVWWVHKDINIMKKDHSVEYFLKMCQNVVNSTCLRQ